MSKTISFVASDELAERLESEANDRMMTVSSTAQILLAEHITQCMDGGGGLDHDEQATDTGSESSESAGADHDETRLLDRHADKWDEMDPDAASNYRVAIPDDSKFQNAGSYRYVDSLNGVVKNLKRWHE